MEQWHSIIPIPLTAVREEGLITLHGNTAVYFSEEQAENLPFLRSYFPSLEFFDGVNPVISFRTDPVLPKEGYELTCRNGRITVYASTAQGGFYALQTLRQLAGADLEKNDSYVIPCCRISDQPRFGWRSFMLDEARHFFGMNTVKRILDFMAMLKMNVFHWHLSDDQGFRVEIKKYPLLTTKGTTRKSTLLNWHAPGGPDGSGVREEKEYGYGCFYTQNQLKEIVAYAKERHIDIVPEIDMPGHLVSAIACYPELSCTGEQADVSPNWGILDNIGCCGKENIYRFAYDIIDELSLVFPFPYFHIGGDEVPKGRWKVCPQCQKRISELGLKDEDALQGYFNSCVQKHLAEKGKHLIGWTEVLDASNLADDAVIQWWIDSANGSVNDWIAKGNKVILSKVDYLYFDHLYAMRPLSKTYSFDIGALGIPAALEHNVLGVEAPQWTEYIRVREKLELNTYPRLQALAEVCWSQRSRMDYTQFSERLEMHLRYMDTLGMNYARKNVFEPAETVSYNVFCETPNCELEKNRAEN